MLQIFANETPSKKLRDMGGCDPRCDISHRVLAHPEREERMDSRNILVTGPAINEQAVKLIADNGYGVTCPPYTSEEDLVRIVAEVDPVGVVVGWDASGFRH